MSLGRSSPRALEPHESPRCRLPEAMVSCRPSHPGGLHLGECKPKTGELGRWAIDRSTEQRGRLD
jgi:hypothetical protein